MMGGLLYSLNSAILTHAAYDSTSLIATRGGEEIEAVEQSVEAVANAIALNPNIDYIATAGLALLALLLLALSAMCSGSEVAFFSLKHNDLDTLEREDSTASQRVLELLKNSDKLLATILVGKIGRAHV